MNIYLISQEENNDYDTYDSFVCYAPDEETARNIHPEDYYRTDEKGEKQLVTHWGEKYGAWCSSPEKVEVKLIGYTNKKVEAGIILDSFNAG